MEDVLFLGSLIHSSALALTDRAEFEDSVGLKYRTQCILRRERSVSRQLRNSTGQWLPRNRRVAFLLPIEAMGPKAAISRVAFATKQKLRCLFKPCGSRSFSVRASLPGLLNAIEESATEFHGQRNPQSRAGGSQVPPSGFTEWKRRVLLGLQTNSRDRSRKSRVDSLIVPLLDEVNSIESLFTLSSCAGRIQLVAAGDLASTETSERRFVGLCFQSHDRISYSVLRTAQQLAGTAFDGRGNALRNALMSRDNSNAKSAAREVDNVSRTATAKDRSASVVKESLSSAILNALAAVRQEVHDVPDVCLVSSSTFSSKTPVKEGALYIPLPVADTELEGVSVPGVKKNSRDIDAGRNGLTSLGAGNWVATASVSLEGEAVGVAGLSPWSIGDSNAESLPSEGPPDGARGGNQIRPNGQLPVRRLLMLVQGPLLHIRAASLEDAVRLTICFQSSGLKQTFVRSVARRKENGGEHLVSAVVSCSSSLNECHTLWHGDCGWTTADGALNCLASEATKSLHYYRRHFFQSVRRALETYQNPPTTRATQKQLID